MFGNLLKSLTSNIKPVKTMASNNFLNAINNLEDIKAIKESNNKVNNTETQDKYQIVFNEGLTLFLEAVYDIDSDYGFDLLKESAEKFSQAISIRKSKPEPYFYLAYIFFILQDISLAIKYFKVAEFMKPDLDGLAVLKKYIEDFLNKPVKTQNTVNKVVSKPMQSSIVRTTQGSKPIPIRTINPKK